MLQKQGKMMQNFLDDKLILIESDEEKCKPCHVYGWGRRAFYLIHFVVSGKGKLFVDKKVYELSAGESFIIKPFQKVKYVADSEEPWHYTWVNFSGEIGDSIVNSCEFFKNQIVKRCEDLYSLFKNVINSENENLAIAHLLVLLNTYVNLYPIKKTQISSEIETAKKYVVANLHRPTLTVQSVADYLCLDRSDLFRKFKRETGKSLKVYITEKRMDLARTLLFKGSTIKETAYSVGYIDPLYFSKAYFAFFGERASKIQKK